MSIPKSFNVYIYTYRSMYEMRVADYFTKFTDNSNAMAESVKPHSSQDFHAGVGT